MIVLSVAAMAILLAASITLIALVMRGFVRDIALSPSSTSALSVAEAGRSQRELQAWRENQAEELEKLIDHYSTGVAEFIGGPLNGKMQALQDAMPTFYWAQALPMDFRVLQEDAEPDTFPQVDEYSYERQHFFSSSGNSVYLCVD